MSATALLLAKADPASADSLGDMQSSVISNDMTFVTSQTERQRMSDLDNLVAVGDWKGVLVAVSQYEGASDAGSFAISILDEQPVSHTIQHSIEYGLESSGMDLRSEVESLVKSVVPEEIGEWVFIYFWILSSLRTLLNITTFLCNEFRPCR